MKIGNIILGNEGTKLVLRYKEKLGITLYETFEIIKKNKTAQSLLKEELALTYTGADTNLSALMRATILRNFYDFEKIRPNEKELIKKYYGVDIGKVQLRPFIYYNSQPSNCAYISPYSNTCISVRKASRLVSSDEIRNVKNDNLCRAGIFRTKKNR